MHAVANPPVTPPPPPPATAPAMPITAPAPVAPSQVAPPGSAAPTPTPVDPASAGFSKGAIEIGDLRRQTAIATERLKLLTEQAKVNDAEKNLGVTTTATADIPELIGIEGTPEKLRAQFLVGSAITTIGVGQWLTSEWRVEKVMSNGVALSKRGGKETHTILFGHAPVKDGTNLLSNGPAMMPPPLQQAGPPFQAPVVSAAPIH